MALKVGGTEVVDNSLGLKNIATVDATTAAAISAAGVGGGGTADFVASGAIASGDVVVLNSDGTVSVAAGATESFGSPVVFETSHTISTSSTFDSNANKVVIAYRDFGGSSYGMAAIGTVSGTSISFGTPVTFNAASTGYPSITFDSGSNKVVVSYLDGGNSSYGTSVVGTVSGTSISFGTPVVFNSASSSYEASTFDSNANKVVIAYRDVGNSSYGTAVVGTVSGTSISFGTPVVFESATTTWISSTFDTNANKVVIAYRDDGNSNYGTAVVGTVSGTSISFGSPVVFNSAASTYSSTAFDSNSNNVVVSYQDGGNANYGTAVVGTVSGTSISFGTPVVFESASTLFTATAFDSNSNKVVISYQDAGNSDYGTSVVGTVSGTSISFETPAVFESATVIDISATFDSNSNKVVVSYQDGGNSNYGTSVVYQPPYTNADDWIGISTEAISDTSTGTITVSGGVNEEQTGLTIGSVYYVADDGSLTTSTAGGRKIGKAIATTKLLITEGNA